MLAVSKVSVSNTKSSSGSPTRPRQYMAVKVINFCLVQTDVDNMKGDMATEYPLQLLVKPHYVLAPQWSKYKPLLKYIQKGDLQKFGLIPIKKPPLGLDNKWESIFIAGVHTIGFPGADVYSLR